MNPPRSEHEVKGAAPSPRGTHARRRDPERTKTALLDAARAEFAEKGLAGARVDEIAARAGFNKQMISYYFGGKEGLHQAIRDEWQAREQVIADSSRPLADVIAGYLEAAHEDPNGMRFGMRELFDQDPAEVAFEPEASEVLDLRARRAAGEISDELDPAFVLLVLMSTVVSSTVFPAETKRVLGLDPGSPEHLAYMREQLHRLVRQLGSRPTNK